MVHKVICLVLILVAALFHSSILAHAQEARSNPVDIIVGDPKETIPGVGEVPPPPSDIRQGIIDEFGITMNGFDQKYLQLSWESFWEVSNSNFFNLVRGSVINKLPGISGSSQVGCPGAESIRLAQYIGDRFFKFIIIHELGHVVRNCNNRETIQYTQHLNAYAAEQGVSYYANNAYACLESDNHSEDYADMVAYFLRPADGVATAGCDPNPNRPNPFFSKTPTDFPAHLQVAETVLGR